MTNSSHILPLFASRLCPLPVGDLFCYLECTHWKQDGFLPTSFGAIEDRLWVKKFNVGCKPDWDGQWRKRAREPQEIEQSFKELVEAEKQFPFNGVGVSSCLYTDGRSEKRRK